MEEKNKGETPEAGADDTSEEQEHNDSASDGSPNGEEGGDGSSTAREGSAQQEDQGSREEFGVEPDADTDEEHVENVSPGDEQVEADYIEVDAEPVGIEDQAEPSVSPPSSGAGEGVVRALSELAQARDELEEVRARAKSGEDRLLRMAADMENYKKRMLKERDEDRKYANERIVRELLPVVDNLERAIEASASASASNEQLLDGVKMVRRQLLDALAKFGVEQFSAEGQTFDPEQHEAMAQADTDEVEPGTVVSEYQKGFTMHSRLLRPAMVIVAAEPARQDEREQQSGKENGSGNGGQSSATSETEAGSEEEES